MTRRRRQAARELAERFQNLPPAQAKQVGRVGFALIINALFSAFLQLVLLVTYVRMVRRLLANRQHGWPAALAAARTRRVITATCLYGGYAVSTRMLLLRWAKRAVERAERDKPTSQDEPTT